MHSLGKHSREDEDDGVNDSPSSHPSEEMQRGKKKKKVSKQIRNFYEELGSKQDPEKDNPNFKIHGMKIPFRMLVVGASGSMKTNSALDVFSKFNGTFVKLYVVCRNADEPLYQLLKKKLPKDQLCLIEVEGEDLSEVPSVNSFNKKEHTLVIFDDLCLVKKQAVIEEFFIRARKVGASIMYLTQSYYSAPKVIRSQCNYIMLKKISSTNDLRMILSEYSLQVDVDQLKMLYTNCTKDKLNWLMIAIDNEPLTRFWEGYKPIKGIHYEGDDMLSPEERTQREGGDEKDEKENQSASESDASEESTDDEACDSRDAKEAYIRKHLLHR